MRLTFELLSSKAEYACLTLSSLVLNLLGPLSAYNIFFKVERQRMLDEQEAAASSTALRRPDGRRAPRIGFAEMARTISQRWKQIDPQEKQNLKFIAGIGRQRYC